MRTLILAPILVLSSLCFGQEGPCNNATSLSYQGYEYDIVEIGDQCWFAENLRAGFYSNGDLIQSGLTDFEWTNNTNGAATQSSETMGWLYNFYAVTNGSGLCPNYWTVPSMFDWMTLINHQGGLINAAESLKDEIEWDGSNSSGFSALPAGIRFAWASYDGYGERTQLWSSSMYDDCCGEGVEILTDNSLPVGTTINDVNYGFAVRCLASGPVLQGCTDTEATNYDSNATADDGSCVYPPGPCNNQTSITYQDYDYDIVEIGDQCWFAENLRADSLQDGEVVAYESVVNPLPTNPAYYTQPYPGYSEDYGKLYNAYTFQDSNDICPAGWKLPNDQDWIELRDYVGGAEVAGNALKDQGNEFWDDGNQGTDDYSFSVRGGGWVFGDYSEYRTGARFWSLDNDCSDCSDGCSNVWDFDYTYPGFGELVNCIGSFHAASIRCIKDSTATFAATFGCTIEEACNYNPNATEDDGSCDYCFCGEGTQWVDSLQACMVTEVALMQACGEGTYWDEEAQACLANVTCAEDLNGDGVIGTVDLLQLLSSYGSFCEAADTPEWSCGDPMNYHGYDYATVQIGDQCWFAENVRTEHYANGDAIPGGLTDGEWGSTSIGAQAIYNNDASNLADYGCLYNWYAVDDSRGLCPSGWHVPTDGEFMTLEMELGMSESEANGTAFRGTDQGTQIKSSPEDNPSWDGTNTSGFSGLAGGWRDASNGNYWHKGSYGFFWSASSSGTDAWPWYRELASYPFVVRLNGPARYGFSVRCIKDAE